MLNIEKMAQRRFKETGTPFLEWLNAFTESIKLQDHLQISNADFELLANNCERATQFSLIIEALDAYRREHPDVDNSINILIEYANDSPYDLKQWLSAIDLFYHWLKQKNRISGLIFILEYISCCTQSAQAFGGKIPLVDVLSDMLDQFGFQQG